MSRIAFITGMLTFYFALLSAHVVTSSLTCSISKLQESPFSITFTENTKLTQSSDANGLNQNFSVNTTGLCTADVDIYETTSSLRTCLILDSVVNGIMMCWYALMAALANIARVGDVWNLHMSDSHVIDLILLTMA